MAINLKKGEKINLTKISNGSLNKIMIGMGWKVNNIGRDYDLDASVLLISGNTTKEIVSYQKLQSFCGNIKHMGDNLVGSTGNNDDEQIFINLNNLPTCFDKLFFIVNIYQAYDRNQHFGKVQKAYIRVVNQESNNTTGGKKQSLFSKIFGNSSQNVIANSSELIRYNLSDNYDKKTGIVVCKIYKTSNGWDFKAIGDGTDDGSISDMRKTIENKYL